MTMTELDTADQHQEEPKPIDVFKEISEAVGKNYSDKETLIRALTEKDTFIEELKKENENTRAAMAELADKVDESINAKRVLEELKNRNNKTDATPGQAVDKDAVTNIFNELLSSKEKETRAKSNFEVVNNKLIQVYGDSANEIFKSKTEALGLNLTRVKELAAESPQAVLTLLGITGEKKATAGAPPSQGNNDVPTGQLSKYQEFKLEMKAKGLNQTHPKYILEMQKRKDLFNN